MEAPENITPVRDFKFRQAAHRKLDQHDITVVQLHHPHRPVTGCSQGAWVPVWIFISETEADDASADTESG